MPQFSDRLKDWYELHKRDLPWRKTSDPYLIWVSEIILQQTRVDQGLSYYLRFTERFPTIADLAGAEEQEVLRLWQGLGYYSRARNMKAAAEQVMKEFGGNFPGTYDEIIRLKGIGPYTAAAISSFAFDEVKPVVDGNVMRVLARYFGIDEPIDSSEGKKRIDNKAENLIDREDPATFNQAIMEFGALQCTPNNPDCDVCPFKNECIALEKGRVNELPIKSKAVKKRKRYFHYAVLRNANQILLRKRTDKDIWQNMYDFPLLEASKKTDLSSPVALIEEHGIEYKKMKKSDWKTHVLSHQHIHARFYEFEVEDIGGKLPENWEFTNFSEISSYPLPKLIESYINGM